MNMDALSLIFTLLAMSLAFTLFQHLTDGISAAVRAVLGDNPPAAFCVALLAVLAWLAVKIVKAVEKLLGL